MSSPEITRLAAALRTHTRRTVARHARASYHGKVLQVAPLIVDVSGLDMDSLDDEEVTIGDALAARLADRGGLQVGDTLTLIELADDDFVAVEVLPG